MDTTLIAWDEHPRDLAADPAATLAIDRGRWEATGASFVEYDDEIGGTTGIATAALQVMDETVEVGVLDHGAATTYLLVPGSFHRHFDLARAVIRALESSGIVAPEDVLEFLPTALSQHEGEPDPSPTATSPPSSDDRRAMPR